MDEKMLHYEKFQLLQTEIESLQDDINIKKVMGYFYITIVKCIPARNIRREVNFDHFECILHENLGPLTYSIANMDASYKFREQESQIFCVQMHEKVKFVLSNDKCPLFFIFCHPFHHPRGVKKIKGTPTEETPPGSWKYILPDPILKHKVLQIDEDSACYPDFENEGTFIFQTHYMYEDAQLLLEEKYAEMKVLNEEIRLIDASVTRTTATIITIPFPCTTGTNHSLKDLLLTADSVAVVDAPLPVDGFTPNTVTEVRTETAVVSAKASEPRVFNQQTFLIISVVMIATIAIFAYVILFRIAIIAVTTPFIS